MKVSAAEASQLGASRMTTGRWFCFLGLASIGCAAYSLFMDRPQSTIIVAALFSLIYLLGEQYRRRGLSYLSEAIAKEFGFRDSTSPLEGLGNVERSRHRALAVRCGMQVGGVLTIMGSLLIAPLLVAVGKEVRTPEGTADWDGLLALSESLVVVVVVLFAESKVYTLMTAPQAKDRITFFRPVGATALWGVVSLFPVAYVAAREASTDGEPATGPDIFLVYTIAALLAALCMARANRMFRLHVRAKAARVVKSPDDVHQHTFSLLLRPFDEDIYLLRDQQAFTAKSLFKGWFSFGAPEERKICSAVEWAGPSIAVGVPGEQLAPDGAARFYLPRHDWHGTVSQMMVRARLVVLILGDSDGVAWELAEAFRVIPPQRLVLIVPVRGASRYTTLKQNLREAMRPHIRPTDQFPDLPPYKGGFSLSSKVQGIIYFTPDWQPIYAPLRAGFEPTDRLALALSRASLPVAAQLHRYESGMSSDAAKKQR
jgi:hypothetical protein